MRNPGDEGAAGGDGESNWLRSAIDETWHCCFHRSVERDFEEIVVVVDEVVEIGRAHV